MWRQETLSTSPAEQRATLNHRSSGWGISKTSFYASDCPRTRQRGQRWWGQSLKCLVYFNSVIIVRGALSRVEILGWCCKHAFKNKLEKCDSEIIRNRLSRKGKSFYILHYQPVKWLKVFMNPGSTCIQATFNLIWNQNDVSSYLTRWDFSQQFTFFLTIW